MRDWAVTIVRKTAQAKGRGDMEEGVEGWRGMVAWMVEVEPKKKEFKERE